MNILIDNRDDTIQCFFDKSEIERELITVLTLNGNTTLRYYTNNFPYYKALVLKANEYELLNGWVSEVLVGGKLEPYVDGKYCYTETKGFYLNPNWVEPTPPAEKYTLDEVATMIASEVNK